MGLHIYNPNEFCTYVSDEVTFFSVYSGTGLPTLNDKATLQVDTVLAY